MAGFKDFNDGNTLTAAEVDGYLMQQAVMRFPTRAALVAALGAGIRTGGMLAWADDSQTIYQYSGAGGIWLPELSLWKTWTPVWTDGTNVLSPGSATTSYTWRYCGGMVMACAEFTRAANTNVGSGNYQWSLPVAAASGLNVMGSGYMRDASPFVEYNIGVVPVSASVIALIYNAARVTNAAPFVPAVSDIYAWQAHYRPAADSTGGAIS